MAVLGIAQLLQPKPTPQVSPDYDRNLRDVEMHDPSCSQCQRAVTLSGSRYDLRDVEVRQPRVSVVPQDNGAEDVVNLFQSFPELNAVLLNSILVNDEEAFSYILLSRRTFLSGFLVTPSLPVVAQVVDTIKRPITDGAKLSAIITF